MRAALGAGYSAQGTGRTCTSTQVQHATVLIISLDALYGSLDGALPSSLAHRVCQHPELASRHADVGLHRDVVVRVLHVVVVLGLQGQQPRVQGSVSVGLKQWTSSWLDGRCKHARAAALVLQLWDKTHQPFT